MRSLPIDPQAESRYGMTWHLAPQFQNLLGGVPDCNLYYVLAHYHECGNYFRLSFVDDSAADRTIFELEGSIGQPLGITLDPPIPSQGAGRLRVECGYINDTDRRAPRRGSSRLIAPNRGAKAIFAVRIVSA